MDVLLIAKRRAERDSLQRKLRLGRQLAALGAPVVTPPTDHDELFEDGGRIWYLTSYGGETKNTWNDQDLVQVGQALARFHTAGDHLEKKCRPPRGPLVGYRDKARQAVQSSTDCSAQVAKTQVLNDLRCLLDATNFVANYERFPKVLTHGDFCSRNVVWSDGRCNLIDLELCGMEIALFDLAFFACEHVKHFPDSEFAPVFQSLTKGYRGERALVPVSGDSIKVVLLLTIVYRFHDAPGEPAWVSLAERVLAIAPRNLSLS